MKCKKSHGITLVVTISKLLFIQCYFLLTALPLWVHIAPILLMSSVIGDRLITFLLFVR